jgi:hypothetical protein
MNIDRVDDIYMLTEILILNFGPLYIGESAQYFYSQLCMYTGVLNRVLRRLA